MSGDECTCRRSFRTAEDFRDHLPCPGGDGEFAKAVRHALGAERGDNAVALEALGARLDEAKRFREVFERKGDAGIRVNVRAWRALEERCKELDDLKAEAETMGKVLDEIGGIVNQGAYVVEQLPGKLRAMLSKRDTFKHAEAHDCPRCNFTIKVEAKPVDMILFCPQCGEQHVDAAEPEGDWTNPPHRSHLCHECGHVWRPSDVPTNGVETIDTFGENDSRPIKPVTMAPDEPRRMVGAERESPKRIISTGKLKLYDEDGETVIAELPVSAMGGGPEPADVGLDDDRVSAAQWQKRFDLVVRALTDSASRIADQRDAEHEAHAATAKKLVDTEARLGHVELALGCLCNAGHTQGDPCPVHGDPWSERDVVPPKIDEVLEAFVRETVRPLIEHWRKRSTNAHNEGNEEAANTFAKCANNLADLVDLPGVGRPWEGGE